MRTLIALIRLVLYLVFVVAIAIFTILAIPAVLCWIGFVVCGVVALLVSFIPYPLAQAVAGFFYYVMIGFLVAALFFSAGCVAVGVVASVSYGVYEFLGRL